MKYSKDSTFISVIFIVRIQMRAFFLRLLGSAIISAKIEKLIYSGNQYN